MYYLMRLPCAAMCALVVMSVWPASASAATPQQVNEAIDKAVKYLWSVQGANGAWEAGQGGGAHETSQVGGQTAMVTYALLAAGESPQDQRMKAAIQYLQTVPMRGTYASGMRAQIWNYLPRTPDVRAGIMADAELLLKTNLNQPGGRNEGLYRYTAANGDYDHSCSNYGVLGLWAISQVPFEIPTVIWQTIDKAWREHQNPDGGWSYQFQSSSGPGQGRSTMSMTSAAVATLFITQDYLYAMQGINCTGNVVDPHIERGIKWMSENFNRFREGQWVYYSLYNIERVGVASGHKYFGTVDWYKHGADFLVRGQGANGSWGGNVRNTAWAIMFLVRGRAPVMLNKLEYYVHFAGDKERPATWNERPRDAANITRWTSAQIERLLNWQIVNLKVDIEELHDAPILYIAGKEALNLKKEDEDKLKLYVEQGGMIVGNADCSSRPFAESFKKLGTKLFGMEFRELPADHPIYTAQQYPARNWRNKPIILGLSNGCRELMILYPTADPGRFWQTQTFAGPNGEPLAQSMANIFLYSVSKQNLRYKGDIHIVRKDTNKSAARTVSVARLQYAGNWDPEPGGWRRLSAIMHNDHSTDLKVETVRLGDGKLSGNYKLAHLTGTTKITLSPAAREEIRKFVEGGGTVLFEAAGGSADFALAAEAELREIFGRETPLGILPLSHPLYSAANKITAVEYRPAAKRLLGNLRTPRLRGSGFKGRTAIFLSGEDLSVGLVGNGVDGVVGYNPVAVKSSDGTMRAGASEIMTNLILYAANPSPPPETAGQQTGQSGG